MLQGASPQVYTLDTTLAGGLGGVPADCGEPPFSPGANGAPVSTLAGSHVPLAGASRHMLVQGPEVEGELADLEFHGEAGDVTFLVAGFETTSLFLEPLAGTQLVAEPFVVLPMGTLDATGQLATSIPLGLLGGAVEFVSMYAQAAMVAPDGVYLAGGSVLTILSASL